MGNSNGSGNRDPMTKQKNQDQPKKQRRSIRETITTYEADQDSRKNQGAMPKGHNDIMLKRKRGNAQCENNMQKMEHAAQHHMWKDARKSTGGNDYNKRYKPSRKCPKANMGKAYARYSNMGGRIGIMKKRAPNSQDMNKNSSHDITPKRNQSNLKNRKTEAKEKQKDQKSTIPGEETKQRYQQRSQPVQGPIPKRRRRQQQEDEKERRSEEPQRRKQTRNPT